MTIERYRQYKRALKATPFKGKFVEYGRDALPRPLHITWMPYSQMFDEFSREIANAVNALTQYTHRLAAWRDVLAPMNQKQHLDATMEFIDPLATIALNLLYVIRSRFIFATAHLCHQANRARQGAAWSDEFPLDDEVWLKISNTYGKGWRHYNSLKTRMEKVGAKDYQRATHDFRNAYNHRFSPQIVLGMSQIVTRHVDRSTGAVSYGFGGAPALTLPYVVDLLEVQCQHCYRSFDVFQKLVREHEAAIAAHNAKAL